VSLLLERTARGMCEADGFNPDSRVVIWRGDSPLPAARWEAFLDAAAVAVAIVVDAAAHAVAHTPAVEFTTVEYGQKRRRPPSRDEYVSAVKALMPAPAHVQGLNAEAYAELGERAAEGFGCSCC
jgi:hypothetical protein